MPGFEARTSQLSQQEYVDTVAGLVFPIEHLGVMLSEFEENPEEFPSDTTHENITARAMMLVGIAIDSLVEHGYDLTQLTREDGTHLDIEEQITTLMKTINDHDVGVGGVNDALNEADALTPTLSKLITSLYTGDVPTVTASGIEPYNNGIEITSIY